MCNLFKRDKLKNFQNKIKHLKMHLSISLFKLIKIREKNTIKICRIFLKRESKRISYVASIFTSSASRENACRYTHSRGCARARARKTPEKVARSFATAKLRNGQPIIDRDVSLIVCNGEQCSGALSAGLIGHADDQSIVLINRHFP